MFVALAGCTSSVDGAPSPDAAAIDAAGATIDTPIISPVDARLPGDTPGAPIDAPPTPPIDAHPPVDAPTPTADAPPAPPDAPSSTCTTGFSDSFGGSALDPCWSVLNGPGSATPIIDVSVTGGALHLTAIPNHDGVWFQGSTRSLVYKTLAANRFKVTTTAHPRKRTDLGTPPTIALHVGGLMVRNPASHGGNTENYLFIMVGSNEGAQPGVEIKSTIDGSSEFREPIWNNPDAAQLRVCRIDSNFYLYKRAPGSPTWILANQVDQAAPVSRPDLPETVQVGLALNFSGGANDLDVAFDDVVLAPTAPATVDDCTAD
jgi:hypothetical protein